MERISILTVLLLLFSGEVRAQQPPAAPAGQGYFFWGPGAVNSETATQHFGGGGEVFLHKGLGIGAEVGYLSPLQAAQDGIGLFSVNGLYEFGRTTPSKLHPFVTGGYSLAFRGGATNAVNFGGGFNYWFSRRAGLRLEFRDHFAPEYSDVHFWCARIGLNLR